MTEFISRKYGNEGYEVIIKTDCHEHYRASEEFARRLIDHAKPVTDNNAGCNWIPVTERLPHFFPKKRQKVLVTLEDNAGKRFTTTAKYHEENEYWYELADCRYTDFKVIAWMEKPAPYAPIQEEHRKSCIDCENDGWDMPQCKHCNPGNDFMYFSRKKV